MSRVTTIDTLLAQTIEQNNLAGVVAMATTANELLYAGASGQRSLDQATPMTLDTLFWIASMTKAVTATAAMQLIEQGYLTLETPAGSILPELDEVQVLTGFDADGQPQLRPPKRAITVHHLLTHTAGFSYDMWNSDVARYRKAVGKAGRRAGVPSALALPLVFDPGDGWEYGINIDWLGRIIEEVTGRQLGAYFAEAIFMPLGMKDTGFAITEEQNSRAATMHFRHADGMLAVSDFSMPLVPSTHSGGGGLRGTGPDYLRFLQMFLNRGTLAGERILAPESVALMAQNQIGDLTFQTMRTVRPDVTNDVNFFPSMVQKWSYSFLLNTEETPQGRSAESLAWAGLGNTYYWIDLQRGIAGLYLTQISPFFDTGALAGFQSFEQVIYEHVKSTSNPFSARQS